MRDGAGDAPAAGPAATAELEPEQPARQLRLLVGPHPVVGTLPVEVVPVDGAATRGDARLRRHPGLSGPQQRQQVAGEGEVGQVVRTELQLETVDGGLPLGWVHHTGVVDEDPDRRPVPAEPLAEGGYRRQRGQVEVCQHERRLGVPGTDLRQGRLPLASVADGQHDLGPGSRECCGDAESDAVTRTRDHGSLTGEVGDGEVVLLAWHVHSCGSGPGHSSGAPHRESPTTGGVIHGLSIPGWALPVRARMGP